MNLKMMVLHCPAGGGHKAAAAAVAEAAGPMGIAAEVVDALAWTPRWFAQAYVGTHLGSTEQAPWLYGAGFEALNRKVRAFDEVRAALDRSVGHDLVVHVRAAAPDVVVATHFFPMSVLGAAWRHGEIDVPVVGVVTDHFAHAFWAERCVDRFCVGSLGPAEDLVAHGIPRATIEVTGIPVRAAFAVIGLPRGRAGVDRRLRILVTSGGFGVGPVARVVRSIAEANRDMRVDVTVVCGDNPQRVAEVEGVARAERLDATVVGFERDMPARLAWADVVVGKPGGLTVSECMAAGRPMVLVGACPGQEMQNQRWLIEGGAGIESEPSRVGGALLRILGGGQLEGMTRRARGLGRPDAASRIVSTAVSALGRRAPQAA